MCKLPVEGLPSGDSGRLLIRLHHSHRGGVARYGIAQIVNDTTGQSLNVLVLGHERADAIFMPYDIRRALGIKKASELDFSINKVGWFGKLKWYINSIDPAVHLPAWLAVIGLFLSILGVVMSIYSIGCS
jgi:hypothetical protein